MKATMQIIKSLNPPGPTGVQFNGPADLTLILGMLEEAKLTLVASIQAQNAQKIIGPPAVNGELFRVKD